MTWPSFRFRVALDSDPLDSTPTHTDLSTRVKSFTFDYGKQSALDEFQPGTSIVVLENKDRELDPLNTSSTYNGKLKLRRRCVLDATLSGTTYDQFTTFNNAWPQRYAPPMGADVELSGTDLFVLLGNIDLPSSVWMLEAAADGCYVWWRLNETTGSVVSDWSGNNRDATLQVSRVDDLANSDAPSIAVGEPLLPFDLSPTLAATSQVSGESVGQFSPGVLETDVPSALPITVEAWAIAAPWEHGGSYPMLAIESVGLLHLMVGAAAHASDTHQYRPECLWNNTTTGLSAIFLSPAPFAVMTDTPQHLVYVLTASTIDMYQNGELVSSSTSVALAVQPTKTFITIGGPWPRDIATSGNWPGRIGDLRIYTSELSSGRIADHYDAGAHPWEGDTTGERIQRIADYCNLEAADLDLDTGATILGPTGLGGDALTYMQSIALSEDGPLYVEHRNGGKLTFNDRYTRWTATRATTSQATFTDDSAAGAGAYRFNADAIVLNDGEDQVINEAVVQWDQGEIRVSDAASILEHGRKSRTYATRLKSANEAQSYGEWQVALYKDAHVRVESLTLDPAGDSNLWVPALSLRYGDRVTFRFKPQNTGSVIQGDYWIQGVHFEADEGMNHCQAVFYLTPAEEVQAFILDDSLLDGTDVLVS